MTSSGEPRPCEWKDDEPRVAVAREGASAAPRLGSCAKGKACTGRASTIFGDGSAQFGALPDDEEADARLADGTSHHEDATTGVSPYEAFSIPIANGSSSSSSATPILLDQASPSRHPP